MRHHWTMSARTSALLIVLGLTAVACGGTPVASDNPGGPVFPAAVLLDQEQAEEFVPEAEPIVQEEEEEVVVTEPTAFAGTNREQGPPGNPTAASLSDPPLTGRYAYKILVQGSFGEETFDFELDAEEPRSVRGGRRQTQLWDIEGFPQEFQYRWSAQELLLERIKTTDPSGGSFECEYDPPLPSLRLPLHEGATWDSTNECGDSGEVDTIFTVIRTERLTIGGTAVDTFVVEAVSTGESGQQTTARSWYAPDSRLFVLQESEVRSEFGSFKSTIEAQSIVPIGR